MKDVFGLVKRNLRGWNAAWALLWLLWAVAYGSFPFIVVAMDKSWLGKTANPSDWGLFGIAFVFLCGAIGLAQLLLWPRLRSSRYLLIAPVAAVFATVAATVLATLSWKSSSFFASAFAPLFDWTWTGVGDGTPFAIVISLPFSMAVALIMLLSPGFALQQAFFLQEGLPADLYLLLIGIIGAVPLLLTSSTHALNSPILAFRLRKAIVIGWILYWMWAVFSCIAVIVDGPFIE